MNEISIGYSLFIIILIATLTFGSRLFPFAVFGRGGKTPEAVTYIGNILPPAVMIMLVVYCIKDVTPLAWPHGIPELISIASVVFLYKFTKNHLIAMVGGTALYMVLIQAVFIV
jgi:branched-subunit amino acid transport protein AzlD